MKPPPAIPFVAAEIEGWRARGGHGCVTIGECERTLALARIATKPPLVELLGDMDRKEWAPANLLDVFGDPVARAMLVVASKRTVTVPELAEQFDVSCPTVYRRVGPLVDTDLLREHKQVDEDGTKYSEYETMLEEVTFSIEEDDYLVDVQVREDVASDFGPVWSDLESAGEGREVS